MKRTTKTGLALALGASLTGSLVYASMASAAPGNGHGPGPFATPSVTASQAVASASLAEDLAYMREEERLARDVYTALAAAHGDAAPFAHIKTAEQQHYDAVGTLLARYGVTDPSAGEATGTFAFPALQKEYDEFVAQGTKSLADAYAVGIAIEKADIADLDKALARTTETDVTRVFTNLKNGSERHLAAFTAAADGKALGQHDGTGQGQQARNGQGTGPRDGSGNGMGRGMGPGSGNPDCPNR